MSAPRSSRAGASLVEILVALALLEVGLLGVVGLVVEASRTVAEAALLERSVTAGGAVADSLLAAAVVGAGARTVDSLEVRWVPRSGGVEVEVAPAPGAGAILSLFVPRGGGS